MSDLPVNWSVVPLGDLLASDDGLTYGIVQPGAEFPDGVPIVRVKDIRHGVVAVDEPLRVDPAIEGQYRRSRLLGGELLVTLVGTVGECAVASNELRGWNTARAVAVARLKDDMGAKWAAYSLGGPPARAYISARLNTTVQATLNLSDLREVPVVVPPEVERTAIAAILGALDEKIESSRRLRAISDDLLRLEVEAAIAAGPTEPRLLGELVERVNEQIQPGLDDSDLNYIGLEHMPRGHVFLDDWGSAGRLTSAKARFKPGDVLFGKLRPYFKKVGVAPVDGVCSTDILVLRPRDDAYLGLVLAEAASDAAIDYASAASTGTRMPRVSWDYLARWPVELPGGEALAVLDAATGPLISEAIALVRQGKALSALRDALLPELLSGRLRVSDAETVAEAVV